MSSVPLARSRGTLFAAALGFVVVLLDVSVVNVALDALRQGFGTDITGLQWVLNAYTLVFAALLLSAGGLGDRMGARRVFMLGFALFTLASAGCGLAPSLTALIFARIAQGMGAAMLVPNSLSMLRQAFPDPAQRSRAVGWWGAAGGIALAAGPVLGGMLVSHAGWRSIFLINLPIGLLGLYLCSRHAEPDRRNRVGSQRGLDLPGQAAGCVTLAALTYALSAAGGLGWAHPRVHGSLLLSLASAAAFIAIESRSAAPMLPLTLFRLPSFALASVCGAIINFAYYGLIFVFSLFFQLEQHLSPQQTGLAFLPMTVVLMAVNILVGRLSGRLRARALMLFGMSWAALGYALLWPVSLEGGYGWLIAPMLIASSGIATMVPTLTNLTMSAVLPAQAGIASGVLNTARQVGGMLGVAVCGFLVRDTEPVVFMQGMHRAIGTAVILLLAGFALCCIGMPSHDRAVDERRQPS
ncbi:DHA2 family methylenomycin A resistance protein-like MFS transporter [Variovorax boronicumulans]|uniref:DHA2 family methylenomycin A resistance protein-like MFS transporter n=1 Tax=Variovorax boronicumulans TaxID=436515 RepID=A0AAW8CL53_9BURK|nr:MFS transporter [Variovorax boronicumulans]MDP9890992.1 DHA2 family methylenomycin A resistance protein-like MFS transporter [Variovorax boronicumulans]MDQ0051059.1 DHA2 family methylenomycin A resistance protein-like MFS transporter [Variovorax boronicumulans]